MQSSDEEEWNVKYDGKGSQSLNDDIEHIYAKDIAKYNSDASEEEEEESDDLDDDDDDECESTDEEFETWISQQKAKKVNKKRKRNRTNKTTNNNNTSDSSSETKTRKTCNRSRSQKLRCRRRFQNLQPRHMPSKQEKEIILSKIKSVDFTSVGHYKRLEAWSDAEVYLCKFIQCVLWDCNFRYNLLEHQFVAVVSVAGIHMNDLLRQMAQLSTEECKKLVDVGGKGLGFRQWLCVHNIQFVDTRGFLLADVMGLGKTISSIAGALLRNYIFKLKTKAEEEKKRAAINDEDDDDNDDDKKKDDKKSSSSSLLMAAAVAASADNQWIMTKKKIVKLQKQTKTYAKLPTIIAGPNDAVLDQWEETLILAGVPYNKIKSYRFNDDNVLARVDHFVLLTRHTMMVEMRNLIETGYSNLFPNFPAKLLKIMKNIYLSSQGKAKALYKTKDETGAEFFTRLMAENMHRLSPEPLFRTFLIDEAHFLKNLEAYWGMFTTCIGAVTDKTVPLTGTPFNNGNQDMATLMTFVNPELECAHVGWWHKATGFSKNSKQVYRVLDAKQVILNVEDWRSNYVIRREKSVLAAHLKQKVVKYTIIGTYKIELIVYEYYDSLFRKVLRQFTQLSEQSQNPIVIRKRKETFTIMMSCMTCMRMSLIHPIIPRGREVTVQFSPSRRNSATVRAAINNELKQECVCCESLPSQKDLSEEALKEMVNKEQKRLYNADGDEAAFDDYNFEGMKAKKKNYRVKSPLVEVPSNICSCAKNGFQHFVHKCCLKYLQDECPRCADLRRRVKYNDDPPSDLSEMYCQRVSGVNGVNGFQTTSKIQKVVEWVQEVPEGEKTILYSFFKSTLDLFEGILVEDLGYECARFDGDMDHVDRARELQRFKKTKNCRVLLATVQSSGTGLNIVEANHVGFIDRWFNPCVHSQAEDRCHRYKQTRDVHVEYFDTSATVDQVMKVINEKKNVNGSILLADGMSIGALSGGVSYQELSGTIGLLLTEMYLHRYDKYLCNHNARLGALTSKQLTDMMENPRSASIRKNQDKKESKRGTKEGAEVAVTKSSPTFGDYKINSSLDMKNSLSGLFAPSDDNNNNDDDDHSMDSEGTIEILDDEDSDMDSEGGDKISASSYAVLSGEVVSDGDTEMKPDRKQSFVSPATATATATIPSLSLSNGDNENSVTPKDCGQMKINPFPNKATTTDMDMFMSDDDLPSPGPFSQQASSSEKTIDSTSMKTTTCKEIDSLSTSTKNGPKSNQNTRSNTSCTEPQDEDDDMNESLPSPGPFSQMPSKNGTIVGEVVSSGKGDSPLVTKNNNGIAKNNIKSKESIKTTNASVSTSTKAVTPEASSFHNACHPSRIKAATTANGRGVLKDILKASNTNTINKLAVGNNKPKKVDTSTTSPHSTSTLTSTPRTQQTSNVDSKESPDDSDSDDDDLLLKPGPFSQTS